MRTEVGDCGRALGSPEWEAKGRSMGRGLEDAGGVTEVGVAPGEVEVSTSGG